MSLENTLHTDEHHETPRELVDLFPQYPVGSDFEHDGNIYIVEEGEEGEKLARNVTGNKRVPLAGLFESTEESIPSVEVAPQVDEATLAEAGERRAEENLIRHGSAIADLRVIEAEASGKTHEQAVHAAAAEVMAEAIDANEQLVGIPAPKHGLPNAAEGQTKTGPEGRVEVSPTDRAEVLSLVRRTAGELKMIDGEIVRLKEKGASDKDLSVLRQAAATIRRDLYKVVATGAPEDYKRIVSSPRGREKAGDEKETQKLVLREFLRQYASRGMSQEKADRLFEEARTAVAEEAARSAIAPEMVAAEAQIDAAVVAESGPEAVSDAELVAEFKAEGVIPPAEVLTEEGELIPGPTPFNNRAVAERAQAMQQEMDALALEQGDHHHYFEMGGGTPIEDHGETNFHPAIAPTYAPVASSTMTPSYAPARMSFNGTPIEGASDWSGYVNRYAQKPTAATMKMGDPNDPSTWALIPMEERKETAHVSVTESSRAEAIPVHAHKEVTPTQVGEITPLSRIHSEPRPVSVEIADRFVLDVGIPREVLEKDPAFSRLSPEQQMLVLRNVSTFAVENLKSETKKSIDREWADQGKVSRVASSAKRILTLGLFGTQGALNSRRAQTRLAEEAKMGEGDSAKARAEFLHDASRRMLEQNPDISVMKDGSLRVNAIDRARASSAEDIASIERFNAATAAWAKIPEHVRRAGAIGEEVAASGIAAKMFDRRIDRLTSAEQIQFESAKEEWEKAQGEIADFLMREKGEITDPKARELAVARELSDMHERVVMEQFFDRNPNAEAELLAMENPSAWSETLATILKSAPKHMAYGAATRIAVVGALGALGVPAVGVVAPLVAAAAISGYSARKSETKKQKSLLREKRASGAISEDVLTEKDIVIIDNEKNLIRKQAELKDAVLAQDEVLMRRLQGEVAEAEARMIANGKKHKVERELREFRDVKQFVDRIDRLTARLDEAKSLAESGDSEAQKRVHMLEHKIATSATMMREYKNKGMLNFKRGYTGVSHAQGYADFAETLAKAEVAVSLDDEKMNQEVYRTLVSGRRERLDEVAEKRMAKEVTKGVLSRVGFAVAGSLIGAEFFHGGIAHAASAHEQVSMAAVAAGNREAGLPDELRAINHEVDVKAGKEWVNAGAAERLEIEKVTGRTPAQLQAFAREPIGTVAPVATPEAAPAPKPEALEVTREAKISHPETTARAAIPGESVARVATAPMQASEVFHGSHTVASGETLSGILRHSSSLEGLSRNAREIAIADFIKQASPEQLRAVGITSGNADVISAGSNIDMAKLDSAIRSMNYGGEPLLEHAAKLARGGASAVVERAAVPYDEAGLDRLVEKVSGQNVPKDEAGLDRLIERVSGGRTPTEGVAVSKDEASFETLMRVAQKAPEGSSISVLESGAIKAVSPLETSTLPKETLAGIKAEVEKVFDVFPDKGEHLRAMAADNVLHKKSPYQWTSVSMTNEYNAMQHWLRGVETQTHISPSSGESVEHYITRVQTTLHEEAFKQMNEVHATVQEHTGLLKDAHDRALNYTEANRFVFRGKSVDQFLSERPGRTLAIGVNEKEYFRAQEQIRTLTKETLPGPGESVEAYLARIRFPKVANSDLIKNELF